MHLVSYIDTQIARVTPLSVARIFGGLLPRLCSFMLIPSCALHTVTVHHHLLLILCHTHTETWVDAHI